MERRRIEAGVEPAGTSRVEMLWPPAGVCHPSAASKLAEGEPHAPDKRSKPLACRLRTGPDAGSGDCIYSYLPTSITIFSWDRAARSCGAQRRSDDPNRRPLPIVRSDQGAEASRGPPAAFPSGSGSRVTLTAIRRASSFVSIIARRGSGSAPSGVDVCERLPVGVVNPVGRPAANEEYQRMDGTRDRSGRSKSGTPSRRRSRLRRPEPS
jgi:hypothetical protein